jgi:hypothetical protein
MAKKKPADEETKPPGPISDEYKSGDSPRFEDQPLETFHLYPGTSREEKIDFALCCIVAGTATRVVVRELVRLCGISQATAESICRDALKHLVLDHDKPKKVLRFISAAWYQRMLTKPGVPIDLQFKARAAIDTLLGIRDPVKGDDDEDDDDDEAKKRIAREKKEIAAILPTLTNEQLSAIIDVHARVKEKVSIPEIAPSVEVEQVSGSGDSVPENRSVSEIPGRQELF